MDAILGFYTDLYKGESCIRLLLENLEVNMTGAKRMDFLECIFSSFY